jgi:hypothetical protein
MDGAATALRATCLEAVTVARRAARRMQCLRGLLASVRPWPASIARTTYILTVSWDNEVWEIGGRAAVSGFGGGGLVVGVRVQL